MSAVPALSLGLYSSAGSNLFDERKTANESQTVRTSIVCNMWLVAIFSNGPLVCRPNSNKGHNFDHLATLPTLPSYSHVDCHASSTAARHRQAARRTAARDLCARVYHPIRCARVAKASVAFTPDDQPCLQRLANRGTRRPEIVDVYFWC